MQTLGTHLIFMVKEETQGQKSWGRPLRGSNGVGVAIPYFYAASRALAQGQPRAIAFWPL